MPMHRLCKVRIQLSWQMSHLCYCYSNAELIFMTVLIDLYQCNMKTCVVAKETHYCRHNAYLLNKLDMTQKHTLYELTFKT